MPPSFRGLLVRAAVIAGIYFVFLVLILGEEPVLAAIIGAFGFALMIPLGMLLDRFRYRTQLKRWQQAHGITPEQRPSRDARTTDEPEESEPEAT